MSNPVNNWEIKDNKLFRRYEFDTFLDAIDFINQVAKIAEEMEHDPLIRNVYNTLEFDFCFLRF